MTGIENAAAQTAELASPDRTMKVSYGMAGITGGQFRGMGTPEASLQTIMEENGATDFELENESRTVEGYTLRYWHAAIRDKPVRGFALYQSFVGDRDSYILTLRMGWTDAGKWAAQKNLVYDVATSIRCTKHLFPAQESSIRQPRGSSKDMESELSTKRQEATMGYQNVYSPSTGQHWEASNSDYNPTGPDGPGYYRPVGNSYEKLSEGFPPN